MGHDRYGERHEESDVEAHPAPRPLTAREVAMVRVRSLATAARARLPQPAPHDTEARIAAFRERWRRSER